MTIVADYPDHLEAPNPGESLDVESDIALPPADTLARLWAVVDDVICHELAERAKSRRFAAAQYAATTSPARVAGGIVRALQARRV